MDLIRGQAVSTGHMQPVQLARHPQPRLIDVQHLSVAQQPFHRFRGRRNAPVQLLRGLQHRPFTHPVLHQIFEYLCRPLHGNMMLIGQIGRPGVYHRAVLDGLPHRRRKAPFIRMATRRTDLDRGAMRRYCDSDGWNVEHLALFIPHRCDSGQGRLTMRTGVRLVGLCPIRSVHSAQGMACMPRLTAVRLVTRLP